MTWRMARKKKWINQRHRMPVHRLLMRTTTWTRSMTTTMLTITSITGRATTLTTWAVVAAIHLVAALIMTRHLFGYQSCQPLHVPVRISRSVHPISFCSTYISLTSAKPPTPRSSASQSLIIKMLIISILLLASQTSVLACEGECMVGITRAWIGNYSTPINTVFHKLAGQISQRLLPPGNHDDPMSFLHPILSKYYDISYDDMKTAIFPSYFHGKCQQNGVEPQGCPNPDCPVVCGTPGSLVHFYPKLRFIAYESTRDMLQKLCSPSSDEYKKTEHAVVRAATTTRKSGGGEQRRVSTSSNGAARGVEWAHGLPSRKNVQYLRKREEDVRKGLEKIMRQVPILLEQACGGKPTEDASGLPGCSWEEAMKVFILTYP